MLMIIGIDPITTILTVIRSCLTIPNFFILKKLIIGALYRNLATR